MKIKLLTSLAGDGFSHAYGAEVDFDEDEAARFIERGLAEAIESAEPAQEPQGEPAGPVEPDAEPTEPAEPVEPAAEAPEAPEEPVAAEPAAPVPPVEAIRAVAVHRGRGSYSVMVDGVETVEKLTRDEAEAFNDLSDEAKADFIAARKG